jgi:hypothetical protein
MAERVFAPLIVGITGKRKLNGKEAAVRAALRQAFELLDRHFRDTPKILLSALAQGTDLIAAEEALRYADEQAKSNPPGCSWQVAAPLPLPPELYLEDFDDEDSERRFKDMLGRVQVDVLEPLLQPVPGHPFERGKPFAPDDLHRTQGANRDRTAHYEQVGLHIADQCGLLIAVMPGGEEPKKIGGTARIVCYRLRGVFDADCRDIRRRSQRLAPLPLDRPQPGPVWVIDLNLLKDGENALSAIALWEPARGEASAQLEKVKPRPLTRSWNVTRLWLAAALDRFNAQVRRTPQTEWRQNVEGRAGSDRGDAASWLRRIRLALSLFQTRYKSRLTKTLAGLALVFIAAIVSLEIHIEFEHVPVNYYVALISFSLVIYGVARAVRLQQYSEDYRAVAEALRVQLGWWDAGLCGHEDRVERTYLGATTGSLGRVRTAVRQLIDAALYEAPELNPDQKSAQRWIDGQITFFEDRIEKRHKALSWVEGLTWFLFIGALGMALFLMLIEREATVRRAHDLLAWLGPAHALTIGLLLVVGLFLLHQGFGLLARNPSVIMPLIWVIRILSSLPAVAAGCVVAVVLVQAAIMHSHCDWKFDQECGQAIADHHGHHAAYHLAHKLILIAMVGIVAIAGAIRFLADKLSLEHELFSYRDALLIFQRAKQELDEIGTDKSPAAQTRRRKILTAIGHEALDENEAWIRAHRLRPLEPIVGG